VGGRSASLEMYLIPDPPAFKFIPTLLGSMLARELTCATLPCCQHIPNASDSRPTHFALLVVTARCSCRKLTYVR
jgi:hypothetical protein